MTHEEFINAIKGMTVIELMDLVKALEAEFGVSAAAPVAAAGAAPAAAAAPAEEHPRLLRKRKSSSDIYRSRRR